MSVALAANLGMMTYGFCFPISAFLLPQLEDPTNPDFVLTSDQGSWFGNDLLFYKLARTDYFAFVTAYVTVIVSRVL